jgi:hypothetical protein
MIVHDSPASFCLSEQQSEAAVGLILAPAQVPASEHDGCVFAQNCDFEI